MGNKSSKKKSGFDEEERTTRTRSSFKESLRSLTGRERRKEPEIPEDKGPKIKLEVPVADYSFPFENVVFEGGGNKGLAYCGAVRALEELGIWSRIRRMAGASSGSMVAALLAVGYNSYQLERYLSQDLSDLFIDHACGCCSFLPNTSSRFGWNPANKFDKWFGAKVKDTADDADITFEQVYQKFGRELCIPVVNVSQMCVEYCHPKTTPDMPIRLAVKMSMTMPGLIQPVKYKTTDFPEYFVDGGLLCNYPIHCFDGWWLSMKAGDSLLTRLNPLTKLPLGLDNDNRFGGYNDRTLGFLVHAAHEEDILQSILTSRGTETDVKVPDSKLARHRKDKKESRKYALDKHVDLAMALKNFLKALKDHGLDETKSLSKNDLQNILSKRTELSDIDLRILFGKSTDAESIFKDLKVGRNANLEVSDLVRFIDRRGLRYLAHYNNYRRQAINTLADYLLVLQETFLTTAGRSEVTKRDMERTVGIDTFHVGAANHNLEREDRQFLIEQGKKSTKAYMEYYVTQRLPLNAEDDGKNSSDLDDLTRFIDDELSEIIDHRDYMEDFVGKII